MLDVTSTPWEGKEASKGGKIWERKWWNW